jgi:CRISPR-associated endonuclease Cas1
MLSYVYSLLVKDSMVTLLKVGLDPYLGFYHQVKYGKPALSLDMIEEFRAIIGDSVVITAINNGELVETDFVNKGYGTSMTSNGKKKLISGYERRMSTLVTHAVFDYSISYRKIMEIQARLLGRYLQGEIDAYPVFGTR